MHYTDRCRTGLSPRFATSYSSDTIHGTGRKKSIAAPVPLWSRDLRKLMCAVDYDADIVIE